MFTKKGFTLIELLVVVLIIGILAAIAVPQYQKAVNKSRLSQAFILLKTIDEAQKVYFLANGKYSTKFADLDISIQGITPSSDWFDINGMRFYQYVEGGKSFSVSARDSADKLPWMEKYYDVNYIICWYKGDNIKKDLCSSLSGKVICNDRYCELK